MELNYLKEFVVLVETRHYAEAADKLYISPACLTRHIQAIEKEFGYTLFTRTSRKVELTDFGRAFFPYAKKIAYFQNEYTTKLLDKMRREEKIIVGCFGALTPYRIGTCIADFKAAHPDITLEYLQFSGARRFEYLRENICDFLLTGADEIPSDEFHRIICDEDHMVAVVSAKHPFAGRDCIGVSDLNGMHLALMSPFTQEDGAFMRCCREAGLLPDFTIVEGNNMIDPAVVSNSVVIASSKAAAFFANSSVAIVEIQPRISSKLALAYRRDLALSGIEKQFLDDLRKAGFLFD